MLLIGTWRLCSDGCRTTARDVATDDRGHVPQNPRARSRARARSCTGSCKHTRTGQEVGGAPLVQAEQEPTGRASATRGRRAARAQDRGASDEACGRAGCRAVALLAPAPLQRGRVPRDERVEPHGVRHLPQADGRGALGVLRHGERWRRRHGDRGGADGGRAHARARRGRHRQGGVCAARRVLRIGRAADRGGARGQSGAAGDPEIRGGGRGGAAVHNAGGAARGDGGALRVQDGLRGRARRRGGGECAQAQKGAENVTNRKGTHTNAHTE